MKYVIKSGESFSQFPYGTMFIILADEKYDGEIYLKLNHNITSFGMPCIPKGIIAVSLDGKFLRTSDVDIKAEIFQEVVPTDINKGTIIFKPTKTINIMQYADIQFKTLSCPIKSLANGSFFLLEDGPHEGTHKVCIKTEEVKTQTADYESATIIGVNLEGRVIGANEIPVTPAYIPVTLKKNQDGDFYWL